MGERNVRQITGRGDAVIVFDRGPYRALRMASDPALIQGYRHRHNPLDYRSEYIHAHLAASLMSAAPPVTVLCLGLGVGAIPSLLSRLYPGVEITAVELNDTVVDAGLRYFGLQDIPRLDIRVQCAAEFMLGNRCVYDQIFVDCYDALGIPDICASPSFLDSVMRSLSQNGLLVANLLPNRRGAASVFQGWTERMEAWCIPGRKKSNHTLYGSRGTLNQPIEVIQRWQGRPLGSFPAAMFECLYRAQPAGQFTQRFAESTP